jgi:RNA polymerase sigma-70 factor (ECF subfamily)
MTSDFIPLPEPSPSDAPTRRQSRRSPGAKRGSTHAAQETYVEDRALIRRLLDREPAAWNEFIQRYERLIASRILATCREANSEAPADLVEDCGAEVMVALFHRKMSGLRQFEGRSKLSTWLAIVVRRTTLEVLRKHQRDAAATLQPDSRFDLQMVPDQRSSRTAEIDVEDRDRLQECLQQLSAGDRKILALQFEQNWSYAEIAEELGVSVNAVGPKLYRARARLKKLMIQPCRNRD